MGGAWALDGLWRKLAVDRTRRGLLSSRRLDDRCERVIFALVANRALEPLSKLAASKWVSERAWIQDLPEHDEDCTPPRGTTRWAWIRMASPTSITPSTTPTETSVRCAVGTRD